MNELIIEVETTRTACAGAAAAYLVRHMAARAGCYAPGIQEHLFRDLQLERNGASLDQVERWFAGHSAELARTGYRILARRIAFRTPSIRDWVAAGEGYRGAVLPTAGATLHPDRYIPGPHAIALTTDPDHHPPLVMVDPWPGTPPITAPPDSLEAAHRDRKYAALALYWSGYS